jgi:hypothetical protein
MMKDEKFQQFMGSDIFQQSLFVLFQIEAGSKTEFAFIINQYMAEIY